MLWQALGKCQNLILETKQTFNLFNYQTKQTKNVKKIGCLQVSNDDAG